MSVHASLHSSGRKIFTCGDKQIIFQAFLVPQPSMIIISFREIAIPICAIPGPLNRLFLPGEDGEKASLPVKLADPNC